MRLALLLLRRATMLRLVPLTALIGYLYAHDRPEAWDDYWVAASAHVAESAVFLGPLVAGAAAWDAKRFLRAGSHEIVGTSSRGPIQRTLAEVAADVVWALPPFLVVLAVQWVQMRPETVGWPSLPLLVSGFVVIAALAVFGAVAGSFLPRFVGPAVVAVAAYLWLVFPPSWNSEVSAHFSVSRSACCPLDLTIDPSLVRAQLVYLLALSALLLVLSAAFTPWIRHVATPRFVGGRAAIALLLVAALLLAASLPKLLEPNRDGFVARTPPDHPVCRGVEPEVCVWPEEAEDLATLEQAAAEVSSAARAAGGSVPARFADPGLFPDDPATRVVAAQGDGEPYDVFVARFARYLLPEVPECAYLEDGQGIVYPGIGVEPLMVAYLTDRAGHPETARAVAGELLTPFLDAAVAAPIDAQQRWFAANVEVMSRCDKEPVLVAA